jgi:hypothetical protein
LDYKDLSPVNEAGRLINPFLTWTYKSVPLMLGVVAHDPWKVKVPLAILNAVGDEGERSEGLGVIPEYQREAGGVVLPKGIRKVLPGALGDSPQSFLPQTPIHTTNEALQFAADIPAVVRGEPLAGPKLGRDLFNLLGLGGVAGGGVKSAAEAMAGQQFFSGRKFTPGSRLPTPVPLRPIFGETMPWEQVNLLNNLLPGITRIPTVAPQGDYEKRAQARRILGQVGGVTVYPVDKGAVQSEKYRRIELLNAIIRGLKDQGIDVPLVETTPKKKRKSSNTGAGWGG